ncbi:MAG TPA: family 78 glycoside hydrolase catalytic domain [Candidatus Limiplasma sp.]|nr:family 78 glycoside hydrolase catalytic domain [Candidatus Limiplasma sp.]HRX09025.1 family 78 glycoside hydrolase catalytic domain [Candidatus Limiplasma sp.]
MELKFIHAGADRTTFEHPVPAPYFRRVFHAGKGAAAELTITGLGFYELYCNGTRITKGRLAPYISAPTDLVYTDQYNLSPWIGEGENVLGVWLGNGLQNAPGGYIWNMDQAPWAAAPCFGCKLTVGDRCIETDSQFTTAPSPVLMDDYHWGEVYDARLELPGWNAPGFDDSAWKPAIPCQRPTGRLTPCDCEPITVLRELEPVSVTREPGGWRYDFGIVTSGVCRMRLKGRAGQRIELLHGEILTDGLFDMNNLYFEDTERVRNLQRDIYYCRGGEAEEYTPTFAYHAFRYVLVKGIDEAQAQPSLLTLLESHSALSSRGSFACSDPMAETIQEITLRSDLSCFHYFPNDCPHREKNGWTADAALSAEQMLLNLAPERSLRQWLANIRMAQDERGALPGIVPTGGWGFAWGNGPAWDCVLFYLPYYIYRYRWDTAVITENAHAMLRYLQYIGTRRDPDGLYHIGLGDWCQVSRMPEEYLTPLRVTDTIMVADIADKAAQMFAAVGLKREEAFAADLLAETRAAFRRHLLDADTMLVDGNCQTSQAMALYYGMLEPREEAQAFQRLLELIHAADDHMDVGVLGGRVLFHVLAEHGEGDLAYRMITRKDYPSYGNWVERGATTLWEAFMPEGDTTFKYSRDHHFWGDVSAWFYRVPGGIRVSLNQVDVVPVFLTQLDHVACSHETPAGKVSVRWERKGKSVQLTVSAPEGLQGNIVLGDAWRFADGRQSRALTSGSWVCVP